jgi:hypothetical protein
VTSKRRRGRTATRGLLALSAVLTAGALLAPSAGAAAKPPLLWFVPLKYASSAHPNDIAQQRAAPPKASLDIPVAAGVQQLRNLKWAGWGSAKATVTGKRRYCAGGRCQAYRSARVELSGLATRRCHPPSEGKSTHPLARRVYTRYRLAASGPWLRAPLGDYRMDCRQLP